MNGIGRVFVKRLHEAFDRTAGRDKVTKALGVLRGTIDPETIPEVEAFVRQCFHKPRRSALVMHACDALLGTHGVEYLGESPDDPRKGPEVEYLNTGDTYAATLLRFPYASQREFRVGSWGDIAERMPL